MASKDKKTCCQIHNDAKAWRECDHKDCILRFSLNTFDIIICIRVGGYEILHSGRQRPDNEAADVKHCFLAKETISFLVRQTMKS